MKVIFLDIDGVMNSQNSVKRLYKEGHGYFNDIPVPETIGPLNKIVSATGAGVVISSTWRKLMNLQGLSYVMFLCGFKGELLGTTPVIHNVERGIEIQRWIDSRATKKITNFVILDDDSDMAHLTNHHIKVNNKVGLTFADAERAIAILFE